MAHLKRVGLVVMVAILVAPPKSLVAQDSLAIQGGRIITMAGETLESGVILIRDGKIVAIGEDLDVPVDASVIDATGKTIMPGFVETHSSAGMSQANETNPNVPYVSVVDSIDPMRSYFDEARRNGVTTVSVVPGNSTMIGGQAAIVKTGGTFVDDMLLKRQAGMKISLEPQGGTSRMGHLSALRAALDRVKNPEEEEATEAGESDESEDEESDGDDDEDQDESEQSGTREERSETTEAELQTALKKLLDGEMPAFIYCQNAMDVSQALRLVDDYELQPILVLGRECYRAAKVVADSGYPVILDSTQVYWETDPRTDEAKKIVLPQVFGDAGVNFVFQVTGSTSSVTLGSNYLWYQAAQAIKYGMSREKALEALTIAPAKILGVDDFVGTLEVGKDADLIILTGEPLKLGTWVETTIVNGQVVYERGKDFKLQRLLDGENDAADTSSQR